MLIEEQSKCIIKDLSDPYKCTMTDHIVPNAWFDMKSYTWLQTHKSIRNRKMGTYLIIQHLGVVITMQKREQLEDI